MKHSMQVSCSLKEYVSPIKPLSFTQHSHPDPHPYLSPFFVVPAGCMLSTVKLIILLCTQGFHSQTVLIICLANIHEAGRELGLEGIRFRSAQHILRSKSSQLFVAKRRCHSHHSQHIGAHWNMLSFLLNKMTFFSRAEMCLFLFIALME